MSKYSKLATDILANIGGKENVVSLVHCITRLRFTLRDETKANDDILKAMDGVVTVVKSGGQYQVVIGNTVADVYEELMPLLEENATDGLTHGAEEVKKGTWLAQMIDVVSSIFQPILGIMAACGMLKGFNTLFVVLGLYSDQSGGYLIINAAGDALFTFLPLFLAYTAAKKFKLKPMIGLALGAAMCYPGIQASVISANAEPLYTVLSKTIFASPVYIDFFGIPIISVDYTGTVIPVILAVWFASKCEKLFNKVVPDLVKFFFVPMLTLLVALPVTIIFLGPIATFGSLLISEVTLSIRSFSPLLAGAVVGATWQILVIFGLHWGFIPVYINNVLTLGYDNVMMPFFACTFATSAVVLAIFFKTKDKKLKSMAIPNFISGIFGVTEPAIYGMLLPLKKPFIISCIAGGIGGAFYGFFNFRKFIMGGMGIFELPNMMNPDGTMGNIIVALVGIVISMTVGFVLTLIFYKDPEVAIVTNAELTPLATIDETQANVNYSVYSPLTGRLIPLTAVEDEAFSSELLGKGVGIMPDEGKVFSPVDGVITTLFPTLHAIGITDNHGVEILIHVGLNTVALNGEGFQAFIKQGDTVTRGQKLLVFDCEAIAAAGYNLTTLVVVTNTMSYSDVVSTEASSLVTGEPLLTIITHTDAQSGGANS